MYEPLVTAVIIAKDEAHDLDGCLDSLKWVDEIVIVVDARSLDATESIARRRATHTLVRTFDHFAAQRNAGIDLASGRWILSIDADERVSDGLRQEIQDLTQRNSNIQAAHIPIQSEILGRTLRYCGTQLDRPVRLFRQNATRWQGEVHERVGPTEHGVTLRSPILHRSLSDLNEFVTKIHEYTSLEAEKLARLGVQPRRFDLTLRPIWTFLKLYLVRRGFLDGTEGFLYCALSAFSAFVRNAKLRERTLKISSELLVVDQARHPLQNRPSPSVRADRAHQSHGATHILGNNPAMTAAVPTENHSGATTP